ncbi:hypothetical protein COU91_02815 [Candidatus Saccharibacteria bacterium CG10_big_fil_rev_8_21_14_0_10_47_8]|nr:MAG: hypothetical protein COU91_02815 [Candidatus Saccharibacteria bacterium CG10_big_fil_rev_8_21_14_0_10_47_8]
MIDKLTKYISAQLVKPIVRYFFVAGFVVIIELMVFVIINSGLKTSYLIATPASNVVAIILNWYLSRVVVFKGSRHKIHIEAGLIIITSVIGIVLQLMVASFCVEILKLLPFVAKVMAIVVVFFYSYWVRKRFIFKNEL